MGRDAVVQQRMDGLARHDEVVKQRVVGEYQCTDGVLLAVQLHHPGGRADAALEPVTAHSPPCAYGALGKVCLAVRQRSKDVLFGDMKSPDVVQAAVVALADHRVHAAGGLADIGVLFQHILHQRGLRRAHTEGVGKQNRRFQRAKLVDLYKAGGLAKAVDNMAGRQHLFVENISRVRQQRRYAGLHHTVCQRAVPHRHARHIADLIQRTFGQLAHLKTPFISRDAHRSSSLLFLRCIIAFLLPKVNRCNRPEADLKKGCRTGSHCTAAFCYFVKTPPQRGVFHQECSSGRKSPLTFSQQATTRSRGRK